MLAVLSRANFASAGVDGPVVRSGRGGGDFTTSRDKSPCEEAACSQRKPSMRLSEPPAPTHPTWLTVRRPVPPWARPAVPPLRCASFLRRQESRGGGFAVSGLDPRLRGDDGCAV